MYCPCCGHKKKLLRHFQFIQVVESGFQNCRAYAACGSAPAINLDSPAARGVHTTDCFRAAQWPNVIIAGITQALLCFAIGFLLTSLS